MTVFVICLYFTHYLQKKSICEEIFTLFLNFLFDKKALIFEIWMKEMHLIRVQELHQ